MRPRILLMVLLWIPSPAALLAQGQGTIADGAVAFTIPADHYDASPAVDIVGVGGVFDPLSELGWWYRVAEPAEKFFPIPDSPNFPLDTSYSVSWTNVDGRGFSAQESGLVHDGGGPSGALILLFTIFNPGPSIYALDLFHMLDIDLWGDPGGDRAALLDPSYRIGLTDLDNFAEYHGLGASAYLVRPHGDSDVAAELSDVKLTNFDSSGLPFGPGDFTGGFQWSGIQLAAGGSRTFAVSVAINMPSALSHWIFRDGFESGNLHVWSSSKSPI